MLKLKHEIEGDVILKEALLTAGKIRAPQRSVQTYDAGAFRRTWDSPSAGSRMDLSLIHI